MAFASSKRFAQPAERDGEALRIGLRGPVEVKRKALDHLGDGKQVDVVGAVDEVRLAHEQGGGVRRAASPICCRVNGAAGVTPTWILESNLSRSGVGQIEAACAALGVPSRRVLVRPFDPDPPDIEVFGPVVFYGATNFVTNVYRSRRYSPGVFFDEDSFRMASYLENPLSRSEVP